MRLDADSLGSAGRVEIFRMPGQGQAGSPNSHGQNSSGRECPDGKPSVSVEAAEGRVTENRVTENRVTENRVTENRATENGATENGANCYTPPTLAGAFPRHRSPNRPAFP
jgi:hypothetical protein